MATARTWIKMAVVGTGICVGGPMLVNYVRPSEEELFQRFNPDLQKRNLEHRNRRQQDFDDYVSRLKEYSKSDEPIWDVMRQNEEEKEKTKKMQAQMRMQDKSSPSETSG